MDKSTRAAYRTLALLLATPALLLGGLHGIRVRSPRQVVLRTAKSVAQAFSIPLAVVSVLAGLLGWVARSPLAVIAGTAGSLLSARYALGVRAAAQNVRRSAFTPAAIRERAKHVKAVQWLRDIPFYHPPGGTPLRCDLWLPPENVIPSGTVVVYLHGGGFFTSSKDFGTRDFFRHLAAQGHAVVDADYRLAPGATLMEMQADARRVVHWVKAGAGGHPVHAQRIVLAGGSAGGLLALLVAYTPGHPQLTPPDLAGIDLSVQGVISYYGVVDLAGLYGRLSQVLPAHATAAQAADPNGQVSAALRNPRLLDTAASLGARVKGVDRTVMRQYLLDNANLMAMGPEQAFTSLLGCTTDAAQQQCELFSPSTHAGPHCPHTLLLHGEHDYLLPAASTRTLFETLRASGARVVYLELPQTEHTFDLFLPRISPPALAAQGIVDDFLNSTFFS